MTAAPEAFSYKTISLWIFKQALVFENCFLADVCYNLWETKSMNALA